MVGEQGRSAVRDRSRRSAISFFSGGLGCLGSVLVSAVAALMLLLLTVGLLD